VDDALGGLYYPLMSGVDVVGLQRRVDLRGHLGVARDVADQVGQRVAGRVEVLRLDGQHRQRLQVRAQSVAERRLRRVVLALRAARLNSGRLGDLGFHGLLSVPLSGGG
jgi:hypothetical protein